MRSLITGCEDSLTLKYRTHFLKNGLYITLWIADLSYAMNVRKFLASILKKNYCTVKTQTPLKQANFMNYILAGVNCVVGMFIFGSHYKKREICLL